MISTILGLGLLGLALFCVSETVRAVAAEPVAAVLLALCALALGGCGLLVLTLF